MATITRARSRRCDWGEREKDGLDEHGRAGRDVAGMAEVREGEDRAQDVPCACTALGFGDA